MDIRISSAALGLFLFSLSVCPGQPVAPPNDHYTNRIVLTGNDISFTGTLAGATIEMSPAEIPQTHLTPYPTQTVWWQWTPTESANAIVQILGSSKDAHGA